MKLKVCGMRDRVNIMAVAALAPAYMGFIFYPGSPRFVGSEFQIPDEFPETVTRVGVFVNESVPNVLELVRDHQLDMVQLHGTELPGYCEELKLNGVKVMKAFSISAEFDFDQTKSYHEGVDYFLFDTRGVSFGGNGMPFDWNLLRRNESTVPFFLSGGLSPENVAGVEKITHTGLYGLDVNSGVETSPGMKNIDRIKQLKMNLPALTE